MKSAIITALLIACGLVSGCDPTAALCMEAVHYHTQRCEDGDSESCEWLQTQVSPPGSYQCVG